MKHTSYCLILLAVIISGTPAFPFAAHAQYASGSSAVPAEATLSTASNQQGPNVAAAVATPITCSPTTAPWVKIISPNGGESYATGDVMRIKWQTCNFKKDVYTQVDINDDRIPGWIHTIFGFVPVSQYAAASELATGVLAYEYAFVVPKPFHFPAQYHAIYGGLHYKIDVIVGTSATAAASDYSDAPFSVQPPANTPAPSGSAVLGAECLVGGAPSVRIISPNGGEFYVPGQWISVRWSGCNMSASTPIALNLLSTTHPNAAYGFVNAAGQNIFQNDGEEYVYLPNPATVLGWPYGATYKLRALATTAPNQGPTDDSDGVFSITSEYQTGSQTSASSGYSASGTNQSATGTYATSPSSSTSQTNQGLSGYQAYSVGSGAVNAGTPVTSASGKYVFTTDLEFGMRGEAVRQLQLVLIAQGLLSSDSATGYYGPLTRAAVQAFQSRNALPAVGRVGPLTRAVLNR